MPDASALQAPAEITADELWRLDGFEHYELDEGKLLEMTPSGPRHGKIALKLGRLLGEHVEIERVEFGLRFVWVPGTIADFRSAAIRARQLRNPCVLDYLVREEDGEERWWVDEGIRKRGD